VESGQEYGSILDARDEGADVWSYIITQTSVYGRQCVKFETLGKRERKNIKKVKIRRKSKYGFTKIGK